MMKIKNPFFTPGFVDTKQPEHFPYENSWEENYFWTLSSDNKLLLFVRYFLSLKFKKASYVRVLMIAHGHSEQSRRYRHFPFYLQGAFDAVIILDHRGHGMSKGLRGHAKHFKLFADDLASVITELPEKLHKAQEQLEVHLLGHSMGGLIALDLLNRYQQIGLTSAAISAPMLVLAFPVPKAKLRFSQLLHAFMPWLPIPAENTIASISKDSVVVANMRADAYHHNYISAACYFSYLELKDAFLNYPFKVNVPLLLQVPLMDKIIDPTPSIHQLYPNIITPIKKLIVYDEIYHACYHEPEREQVFNDLKNWILQNSIMR